MPALKTAPPEEIAKLRAEADAREAQRRKDAAKLKEQRQALGAASLAKAVSWFKALFTPAPQVPTRQWKRHAAQKLAKKNARLARRAQALKSMQFGDRIKHVGEKGGKLLTRQERRALPHMPVAQ